VLRRAVVLEEVLGDKEKLAALELFVSLFEHFADDRRCGSLARLDSPARQSPYRIARQTVQQRIPVLDDHGRRSKMKPVTANVEADHAL